MRPKKRDVKPMTFRFTEEAQQMIRELTERSGLSMTSVLETLIRREHAHADVFQPRPLAPIE